MEAPAKKKKKRGRPGKVDQPNPNVSAASTLSSSPVSNSSAAPSHWNGATRSTGDDQTFSNAQPCHLTAPSVANIPSHPYQYATEIDTDNDNLTANDWLDNVFGPIQESPNPDTIFQDSHHEQLMKALLNYTVQDPSPSQGTNEEWNKMMGISPTSANLGTPDTQISIGDPFPTLESSPSSLIPRTINPANNRTTNSVTASHTSPATPYSDSPSVNALEQSCTPPLFRVPKASLACKTHTPDSANSEDIADSMSADGEFNDSAPGCAEPQYVNQKTPRQRTPVKQPLGSPFTPTTAPARQATAALMDIFGSPLAAGNKQLPTQNMSLSSPATRKQNSKFSGLSPTLIHPSYQATPVEFKSPPNPATLMQKMRNNTLLQNEVAHPPAKRARMSSVGAQQVVANIERDWQVQQHFYTQSQQGSGTGDPALRADLGIDDMKNWLDNSLPDISPTQSLTPYNNEYDYPIPMPTGSFDALNQEHEDYVSIGQKRTASQMIRGGMDANLQSLPGSMGQDYAGIEDNLSGLFVPLSQLQTPMLMEHRTQNQMNRQTQKQTALCMQGRPQRSAGSQLSASPQAQFPTQGQRGGQQELQISLQTQNRGQIFQSSPSQQMGILQQRRSQQGTPQNPIDTPLRMLRSTPSVASTGRQETPTPAPRRRRRSNLPKPAQNMVSSSPQTAHPSLRKVQNTLGKTRAPGHNTPVATAQKGTAVGHVQMSDAQPMQTPGYTRQQDDAWNHALIESNAIQTPTPLHAHLPTPQQLTSTGSCPNTINETLEETNRRTGTQLCGGVAGGVDLIPTFNATTAVDDFLSSHMFQLPDNVKFGELGLALPDMDFGDMMGMDMSLDFNMNEGLNMNGFTATAPPPLPATVDMRPLQPPMIASPGGIAAETSLGHLLFNNDVRAPSIGYAETLISDTVTPSPAAVPVNNTNTDTNIIARTDTAVNFEANGHLCMPENSVTNDSKATTAPKNEAGSAHACALPNTLDGGEDITGVDMPGIPTDFDWIQGFDEHADFSVADWGF
ncbi:hypothetical protein A1O7_10158 [Cladophialophora yegresii CBS 114405]|uniref:Uncharacterized protein n=1 Tax=Cladophialophora yegresii CBS 114405 TaxID=1182544 RepID=W9VGQ3_9EURO|nr:uncharacterized protein A1O7_10158 [Cladophialophora yegresii CBS 114405]EXJ54817.1 hypothetical protein A1O7_10158 [Cladophialophora yegresii CBS 114405]